MQTKMDYDTLHVTLEGKTAIIELNRPKSLNAMNIPLLRELLNCLTELKKDKSIQILILKGKGGAFSSGGDIKEMLAMASEQEFHSIMETIGNIAVTLYTMPKVTIAGIHGAAAGLGLSLALACDYLICEEDSKLAMNFIGIGLIPDGGGHFFMEQRLGVAKAKQMIWKGKVIGGQEALLKGMVEEVVAAGKLDEAVESYTKKCLHSPLQAMIKTKNILTTNHAPKLIKMLEMEKEGQWTMRQTKDHQEGVQAFIEKRKPKFQGE
ncbi:enoyl-CoA hydratase [Bacillus sp. 2205SS5-2]|uniref:enoyl-CoA hydratase n=1 Tax=Bacillus sp. 2205SS5-2 TaxID=3109031 RepID=UPI0030048793